MAYVSYLAGHRLVGDAMADHLVLGFVGSFLDEVLPTVPEVAGIDLGVCRRLNETLQGTAADRAPPADLQTARDGRGWTQGCWAEAGAEAGTWFKEVFAEVHCRGGNCRGGDVVAAPTREATVTSAPPDAESVPLSPLEALTQCAAREAAAGICDPQVVAARCTVSS